MYRVGVLKHFKQQAKKQLSPEQYRQLDKLYDRLSENPWIGDPLGPEWLRETRTGGKRIYYIVGERAALVVGVSAKKNQQTTIDGIRERLSEYKLRLEEITP